MTRHTPGPWHVEDEHFPRIFDEYGTHLIAITYGDEEEKRADACLIAAAPALLNACRDALAIAEDRQAGTWDTIMLTMRAVIALAERETP